MLKYLFVLLLLIVSGCKAPATDELVVASAGGVPDSLPLQNRVFFVDKSDRDYFFDFEYDVARQAGTHSGVNLSNCSTDKFHCYAGDTIIASPKDCATIDLEADWSISEKRQLSFVDKDSETGDLYFMRIRNGGKYESSSRLSDGFIFNEQRGIVGFWFSAKAVPAIAEMSPIFRLTRQHSFLPCMP